MSREFESLDAKSEPAQANLNSNKKEIESNETEVNEKSRVERHQVVLIYRFVFDVTSIIQAFNVKLRLIEGSGICN